MVSEVIKGWGKEVIFANQDYYCGKLLHFDHKGSKCSMHFHANKDETWYVIKGSFIVKTINKDDASINSKILKTGDVWRNPPLLPHQLESLEDGSTIVEVSTNDDNNDNYRVMIGDSQQ